MALAVCSWQTADTNDTSDGRVSYLSSRRWLSSLAAIAVAGGMAWALLGCGADEPESSSDAGQDSPRDSEGSPEQSLRELTNLQQRVVADRERDRLDLGVPYDIELDRSEGVIVVTVAERTGELVEAFQGRYGDGVMVKEGLLAQPEVGPE